MTTASVGRGSPRHPLLWRGEPRPTDVIHAAAVDRAILSYTLLIAVLVAGFITSLRQAQTNEALTSALAALLN